MRTATTFLLCLCVFFSIAQQPTYCTVYFDFDKAVPTAQSQKELNNLLNLFKTLPLQRIVVKGHADKQGRNEYNDKLSQERADAVASQLKAALPPDILVKVEAFGENDLLTADDATQNKNRRVEVLIEYAPPKPNDLIVQPFFEDVEEQRFAINFDDTVTVQGRQGTVLKIAPGSVLTKGGTVVKGRAEIRLKEYYEPGDILLAGMHSSSNEGLLQTGGMFTVLMLKDGDTLASKTKKKITIRQPVRDETLTNMKVFTAAHSATDSAVWQNTGILYNLFQGYWQWPENQRLTDGKLDWNRRFSNMRVGSSFTEDYQPGPWICIGCGNRYPAKSVLLSIKKMSKDSLWVNAKLNYRNKGRKRFGIANLDTAFYVTYKRSEYEGAVSEMNWINCDRFYQNTDNTEFYVSTPGYTGMNVLVYFKRLNAFMMAQQKRGTDFRIPGVPANESVYVVAFGKTGDEIFFSRQPYTIQRRGSVALRFSKMNKEDFKKEMSALN